MTTSITNEYTSLQKYKSLTLYFRKGDVLLCVRDVWRQGQTAILTQVFILTTTALLPHLCWGCSTVGHWGPRPLQDCSHFGILVSDCLTAASSLSIFFLIVHLLPRFFGLFTQVHLLMDGSVKGHYITPADLPFSPKLQTFYCIFKSHAEIWTRLIAHIFSIYGWLSELTDFRLFPVICWSYLWTDIFIHRQ